MYYEVVTTIQGLSYPQRAGVAASFHSNQTGAAPNSWLKEKNNWLQRWDQALFLIGGKENL